MKMTKKKPYAKSKNLRHEKGPREKLRDLERKKLKLTRRLICSESKKVKIRSCKMKLPRRRLRNRDLEKRKPRKREFSMNKTTLKCSKLIDLEKPKNKMIKT